MNWGQASANKLAESRRLAVLIQTQCMSFNLSVKLWPTIRHKCKFLPWSKKLNLKKYCKVKIWNPWRTDFLYVIVNTFIQNEKYNRNMTRNTEKWTKTTHRYRYVILLWLRLKLKDVTKTWTCQYSHSTEEATSVDVTPQALTIHCLWNTMVILSLIPHYESILYQLLLEFCYW
jgi:hypothetical protein